MYEFNKEFSMSYMSIYRCNLVSEWVSEWVSERVSEWASERVRGWASERASGRVSEPASDWLTGRQTDRQTDWLTGWVTVCVCCRIWSWSPMPCEKHGPRDSVDKNRGRSPRFFSLLRPEGHVFHTAWETMIKSYYSTLAYWFFSVFCSHKCEF